MRAKIANMICILFPPKCVRRIQTIPAERFAKTTRNFNIVINVLIYTVKNKYSKNIRIVYIYYVIYLHTYFCFYFYFAQIVFVGPSTG